MQIIIDVPDWLEENQRNEESAITYDDLITLAVEKGYSTAQLTRMHIVQRELGMVEDDVLPENKQLLQTGGVLGVNQIFARAKKEIELKGKRYSVRMFIAPVREEEDEPVAEDEAVFESATGDGDGHPQPEMKAWQVLGTEGALEEAEKYLDRRIPGYVMGRLLIIHECGGDVRSSVNDLQDKIEQMAEDLA